MSWVQRGHLVHPPDCNQSRNVTFQVHLSTKEIGNNERKDPKQGVNHLGRGRKNLREVDLLKRLEGVKEIDPGKVMKAFADLKGMMLERGYLASDDEEMYEEHLRDKRLRKRRYDDRDRDSDDYDKRETTRQGRRHVQINDLETTIYKPAVHKCRGSSSSD